MPELRNKNYLRSSLLDHLTDDKPKLKNEPYDEKMVSHAKLRKNVIRDLNWLFSSSHLATDEDLNKYPQIVSSVLNYGMPNFTGQVVSNINAAEIERSLKRAICDFEPRILRHSLKVKLNRDEQTMGKNAMIFDIEGELWADPEPLQFYLKTNLNFETGKVEVYEDTGSSK